MRKVILLLSISAFGVFILSMKKFSPTEKKYLPDWNATTSVADVLNYFGEAYPKTKPVARNKEDEDRGFELFTTGITTSPEGKKTAVQSKYFKCTHCHNIDKEDPDLRVSDPVKRLEWCKEKNLAFLPGTTMYGIINKVSWYNGDYYKKYGDLVKPANSSIEAAIHLCATVCSQGRDLEEWEMKAMLAYYWSLEYKLGDLSLSESDWTKLKTASATKGSNPEMVKWLKTFYLSGSPATFGEGPADRAKGFQTGTPGNTESGAAIYSLSCMKCHYSGGPGEIIVLDDSKLSKLQLIKNLGKQTKMSIYEAICHGIPSESGTGAYMPLYPLERMNEQQIEDLRAFLVK